jgi:hypothetical protein
MSNRATGVYASDGKTHLTPEQIVKFGVLRGVIAPKDEAAWNAYAQQTPGDALTAVCRRITAAGPVTPATPATARSGASVAAGSGVPGTTYPRAWDRAVSAAQRVMGSRRPRTAQAAWPTVTPSAQVVGTSAPASSSGFYDKSPKASAFAASQEQARQADLARMAAEQAARFSA